MSWEAYAKRGEECTPKAAIFLGSLVLGKDGTKWAHCGTDYGKFGQQIAKGGAGALKNDFLGERKNMMWVGAPEENCEVYKAGDKGAAICASKQAISFVLVRGTPQDALLAAKGMAAALTAVNY